MTCPAPDRCPDHGAFDRWIERLPLAADETPAGWVCVVGAYAGQHHHETRIEALRCADERRLLKLREIAANWHRPNVTYVNASDDKYPDLRTGSAFVKDIEDTAIDEGLYQ